MFTCLSLSCHKDSGEAAPMGSCNFTNFRYLGDQKDTLGEISNMYLSVMFNTNYSENDARKFISSQIVFDQTYKYIFYKDIDSNKSTILKFSIPRNCEEITEIINHLHAYPIVSAASYTMKTNFCQNAFGYPMGNLCVARYTNLFFVKVFDKNNLTDLYKLIASTNTEFIREEKSFLERWYILRATKYSKGNALQMSNFFHESKLFEETELDYGYYPVE